MSKVQSSAKPKPKDPPKKQPDKKVGEYKAPSRQRLDYLYSQASNMAWDQLIVDNTIGTGNNKRKKKKTKKFKSKGGNSLNPNVPTTTPS